MHLGRTKIKPQFVINVYIYYIYVHLRLSTASENKPNQIILQCVVVYMYTWWPQESATAVTATATAGGTEMLFHNKLEIGRGLQGSEWWVGQTRWWKESSVVYMTMEKLLIYRYKGWEKANILLISTHDIYSGDCVNFIRRLFLTRTVKLWCFFGDTITAITAATVGITCMGCRS